MTAAFFSEPWRVATRFAICALPATLFCTTAFAQTATQESRFGLPGVTADERPVAPRSVDWHWDWGVRGGGGYFNFQNSLFRDFKPGVPENPEESWFEGYLKGWLSFRRGAGGGEFFGKVSYAVAANGAHTADLVGGEANSQHIDELYLGWRRGSREQGLVEIQAGRTPYVQAHQFLLADGYADGGSRGGYWSNARTAWAPGAVARLARGPLEAELFWLRRDEQPDTDTDTRVQGVDLAWRPLGDTLELGAAWLHLQANALASQRDGARVVNLRAYWTPGAFPLTLESEWVGQSNGAALDASAAYLQAGWTFGKTAWNWQLEYRYAWFSGDDPATAGNENYDPLFPGFLDWGTWWQGEIAGEYFLSNSNLRTHMVKLRLEPLPTVSTGLVWFDYTVNEPGSYAGGIVDDDLGRELNWYLDWNISDFLKVSVVLAQSNPGTAAAQAFERSSRLDLAFAYLTFHYR